MKSGPVLHSASSQACTLCTPLRITMRFLRVCPHPIGTIQLHSLKHPPHWVSCYVPSAAEHFGDRSDVQCLHRWQKVLNPDVHKGPWTADEDEAIVR
jgi:hypothetical protein